MPNPNPAQSRIFIVHLPLRSVDNEVREVYDVSPALEFASEFITPIFKGRVPVDTVEVVKKFKDTFFVQNYSSNDYILCIGDPSVIAVATAIASRIGSPVRLLVWDKQIRRYSIRNIDFGA